MVEPLEKLPAQKVAATVAHGMGEHKKPHSRKVVSAKETTSADQKVTKKKVSSYKLF